MDEDDGRIEVDQEDGEQFGEKFDQEYDGQESQAYLNSQDENHLLPLSLCLQSTLTQIALNFIIPILVANVVLRLILSFIRGRKLPGNLSHGISAIVGLLLLAFHFRESLEVLLTILIYFSGGVFLVYFKSSPSVTWTFSVFCLTVNEYLINVRNYGTLIRGRMQLMMMVMKLVSISGSYIPVWKVMSYLLHPVSLVQGVWFPISLIFDEKKNHKPFIFPCKCLKAISQLTLSLVFLISSNCTIEFVVKSYLEPLIAFNFYNVFPESMATFLHLIFVYYFVALQFRLSHYFMASSTDALFAIHGLEYSVSKASKVEFPRSLVDVVISWNIPMHQWIKQYVFLPLTKVIILKQKRMPLLLVILTTYAVSSLLHGVNMQIWSVLLTLGFLTFIEFKLRQRLSSIFSLCVEAKACKDLCLRGHKNSTTHILARLINCVFVTLSILHLIFLGSAFDGNETSSYSQVYETWSILQFFSPLIGAASFLVYLTLLCI